MKRGGRTYQWPFATFVTHPSGRAHTHGADDGRVGWRLHYVAVGGLTDWKELDRVPALCGLVPRIGWGGDLFVDTMCARCEARAEYLNVWEPTREEPIITVSYSLGDGWGGYLAYQAWCQVNRKNE